MLHRCAHNGGGGAAAPPCSCGMLHGACGGGGAAFSILFPMSSSQPDDGPADGSPLSSSTVDCTLSLGTPSTRHTTHRLSSSTAAAAAATPIQRSSCNMSSLCWGIISHSGRHTSRGAAADGSGGGGSNLGGDPLLLARRCANCDTTSTPLWRNGPRGPKSLCNACGIRYKKEERRAAASSPSPSPSSSAAAAAGYSYQRAPQHPWSCYAPGSASPAAANEDEDERESPYLSWRLNVVPPPQFPIRDGPSLFQYQ